MACHEKRELAMKDLLPHYEAELALLRRLGRAHV